MRITGSLTAILITATSVTLASGEQPFRILAPQEVTQHRDVLRQLQGEQREKYRDEVYRDLVQRAQAHGYRMPPTPPWQQSPQRPNFRPGAPAPTASGAAAEPSVQADLSAPKPDMPKLVAQQKRVIEEAVQQELTERSLASAAQAPEPAEEPAKKTTSATDDYREKMRQRFDDFMARRDSRQHQGATAGSAPSPQPGSANAPATTPMPPAPPSVAQPPAYPMPPAYPRMMPPRFPAPAYPQPAYPAPGYRPQPYFPQPAYPQGMAPPPAAYPPRAPGWY